MVKKSVVKRLCILWIVLYGACLSVSAQQKIQVVTKTITRTFTGENRFNPVIRAEKADVVINSWSRNELQIVLKLISKNPSRKTAADDIEMHVCSFNENEKSVIISNTFRNDKYSVITSNLSVVYEIWCPLKSLVTVSDLYGAIRGKGVNGSIRAKSGFCQVELEDIKGALYLESSYDNLNLHHLHSGVEIVSSNSDMNLGQMSGKSQIDATYGTINICLQPMADLWINAKRTAIQLIAENIEQYNFDLQTTSNTIDVPELYRKMITKTSGTVRWIKKMVNVTGEVRVSTTYCSISLNKE
jgi:hypothetical protein